jgi:hypothetical protein
MQQNANERSMIIQSQEEMNALPLRWTDCLKMRFRFLSGASSAGILGYQGLKIHVQSVAIATRGLALNASIPVQTISIDRYSYLDNVNWRWAYKPSPATIDAVVIKVLELDLEPVSDQSASFDFINTV